MAVKPSKADKKIAYDQKLCQLLDEYTQILIAAADNVGSNQLQNIRKGLRGDSVVLMGKNTMMKRSIRLHAEKTGNQAFLNLIPLLVVRFRFLFLPFISLENVLREKNVFVFNQSNGKCFEGKIVSFLFYFSINRNRLTVCGVVGS